MTQESETEEDKLIFTPEFPFSDSPFQDFLNLVSFQLNNITSVAAILWFYFVLCPEYSDVLLGPVLSKFGK